MDEKSAFGTRLFTLRKQKRLTQYALEQRFQITQEAVSQYELGRGVPRFSILVRMAQELNTTADYLLGMTEDQLYPPLEVFSVQERQVITEFRQLSPKAQERVIGYLHGAKENEG